MDTYKEYKMRDDIIYVKPPTYFLIEPDYFSEFPSKPDPISLVIWRVVKKTLLIIGVLLGFLVIIVGGSILIGKYMPILMGYWWLLAGMLGWLCGSVLFDRY